MTYEDDEYELFRSPTDPNKKFTLEDAFALQRNRFEHLNGRFVPDDQIGVKKQGIMVATILFGKTNTSML